MTLTNARTNPVRQRTTAVPSCRVRGFHRGQRTPDVRVPVQGRQREPQPCGSRRHRRRTDRGHEHAARGKRLVVLEFESAERAKQWWASEEYREAKALRQRTAQTNLLVIEGA